MKRYALLFLCMLCLLPMFSQSAAVISDILEKQEATYGDFSYFIAAREGKVAPPAEGFTWGKQFEAFPGEASSEDSVSVKTVSFFLMNSYELPGGLMWSATQKPRYAWRELKANGFWKTGTDPDHILGGQELVQAMNRFAEMFPEAEIRDPRIEDGEAYE